MSGWWVILAVLSLAELISSIVWFIRCLKLRVLSKFFGCGLTMNRWEARLALLLKLVDQSLH